MANWSQSHFLQSLGWATLNSFWQMALLWCLYLALSQVLRLNTRKRYELAVSSLIAGFGWALFSFFSFYQSSTIATLGFFDQAVMDANNLFPICLLAASLTYLALLAFPSYRLYRNWLFVRKIKKDGLHKANVQYRLYVQKIAGHLGITRKVAVYVSELIKSPLTIGYIKPVILLPMAALSNLNTSQVEAVLLHELSHIRRFDYLVNLAISIIQTLLYFNPFVKQFMNVVESERENCCDELVLQFGYDKVGYASALLTLEKISTGTNTLAMAATGKNYLLSRIERIVGLQKKKTLKGRQLAGMLATVLCIIALNSVLIIKETRTSSVSVDHSAIGNPFALFYASEAVEKTVTNKAATAGNTSSRKAELPMATFLPVEESAEVLIDEMSAPVEHAGLMAVSQNSIEASLSEEQKAHVAEAVAATKQMVSSLQWKQIEAQIGEAMTSEEKRAAELDYRREIEKINWHNLENNLKAQYEAVDWTKINGNLNEALTEIQLDSLQKSYQEIIVVLSKTQKELAKNHEVTCAPIPDASVEEIQKKKEEIKVKLNELKVKRAKVIRL